MRRSDRSRTSCRATGVGYPHGVDVDVDVDGALLNHLGVPGLPVTLAVDGGGRVIATQVGPTTSTDLEAMLAQLEATERPEQSPPP